MKSKYYKAISFISAASVIGVVLIMFHAYKDAVDITKEHHGEHHLVMAAQVARSIENDIEILVEQLEHLSKEPAIREMDLNKARKDIEDIYEHVKMHSVDDIALMDSKGVIRLPLRAPELTGRDFSFREYYREARVLKKSSPVYEYVEFRGVAPGQKGIIIAMPVFSRENRFNGLVLFTVKVNEMLQGLMSMQAGSDKEWVVDGEGNILYHPDYAPGTSIKELVGGSESFREFLGNIMAGKEYRAEYVSPAGVPKVAASHSVAVAGQRLAVVVSSPIAEVRNIIAHSSIEYVAGILLLLLGASGVVMILRSYNSSLREANDELELRVKERTADLTSAVDELAREVAERRRAEEQRKGIIDAIPDLMFIIDSDGTFVEYHAAKSEELYAPPETIVGGNIKDLIPQISADTIDHIRRVLDTEEKGIYEYSLEMPNGTRNYEAILAPYNATEVIAITRDITARKQAEDALRESHERLKSVLNSLDAIVYVADMETHELLFINEYVKKIFGDITGETCWKALQAGQEGACEFCSNKHLLDPEGNPTGVYRWEFQNTVNGHWYELHDRAIQWVDGRLVRLEIAIDITDRKRAEEESKELNARLQTLFDAIPGAVLFKDDGGRVVLANKGNEDLSGIKVEDIIGKTVDDFVPAEVAEQCIRSDDEVIRSRATIRTEEYAGDKSLEAIKSPIFDDDGRYKGMVVLAFDITNRKRAEEAIRENKQFLENILNSIQDGIFVMDKEFNIVMANPTMEKWYAHAAPLEGKKCYEVFRGRSEKCEPCECRESVLNGGNCFKVINYVTSDGREGTREMYVFPLYSSKGDITGTIQYFRDITNNVTLQAEAMRAAQLASVGELAAGVAHEINNPINGILNYAQLLANRLPEGSEDSNISRRIIKEGDRISGIVSALLSFTRADRSIKEPVDVEDAIAEVLSMIKAQLKKDGISVRDVVPTDMPPAKTNRLQLEQVFLNVINNARHALNSRDEERHGDKVIEIQAKTVKDGEGASFVRITFTDNGTGIPADMVEKVKEPFFTTKQKGQGTGLGLSISESIIDNYGGRLKLESEEGRYTSVIIDLPSSEEL